MSVFWSDEYITGIPEFDKPNKEFFRLIDSLLESQKKETKSELIQQILNFLDDYTSNYLKVQEKYMKKYGYQNNISHSAIHSIFKKSVANLKQEYSTFGENTRFSLSLTKILINWLISHVSREDKELAIFLSQKVKLKHN